MDHLKPYEAAARILCNLNNTNPDEEMRIPSVIAGAFTTAPMWHQAAENLIGLSKMLTALRLAAQQQATSTGAAENAAASSMPH